eukprot:2952937-Pyramimonas_sp.AAC.1
MRAPKTARPNARSPSMHESVGKPSKPHMAVRHEPPVTTHSCGSQQKKSPAHLQAGAKNNKPMMILMKLRVRCHA